jgi:hypothetical protein
MTRALHFAALVALAGACGTSSDVKVDPDDPIIDDEPEGIELLGGMTHSIDSVSFDQIASASDGLNLPRDLAFHPDADELWIVSELDHSVTILEAPGTDSQRAVFKRDVIGGGNHFLAKPAGIAFGDNGFMAVAPEEDEKTQGNYTPADFMGPTLFSADSSEFDGGHASHYDMLHNSPNSVGIAHSNDNVYWIYDGYHRSLTRYDFRNDHGAGGSDHSDGVVWRYVDGEMGYEPGISSHLVYDTPGARVLAADSENNAIRALDVTSGEFGSNIYPQYDYDEQRYVDGAVITDLISGIPEMEMPSGLELHDGMIWVGDAQLGRVLAFTMDGELIDWLDTGLPPGALQGMAFSPEGDLYVVDAIDDRVMRISI